MIIKKRFCLGFLLLLATPALCAAQGVVTHVSDDSTLRAALASAASGDTIIFDAGITLAAELPNVAVSITIDGNGHSLSGNNQFRGLFIGVPTFSPPAISVAIQNLTITNAVAVGGAGGSGAVGGGGGAECNQN
jgi:hypothetical protein